MSLRVFKAGILDSIQDNGRYGYQDLGINPGGAMDQFAAKVANLLVGNSLDEAVIELHFPASIFIFQQSALISISGADFSASISGEKIPFNHPVLVNKSSILQFHSIVNGARAYLAVSGGFEVDTWLGSASTHLKAGAGGYKGRSLRKDDEILFRNNTGYTKLIAEKEFIVLPWSADTPRDHSVEMFVLPGNEWERLTTQSKESFYMTSFVITQQSDRMGYRLNNIPLPSLSNAELVSSAVDFGTVQLLPDGRLIVLMADHQTTGGYPRIAHVISAHHSKLAQMKPGDKLRFCPIDQTNAEEMMMKQQQHLLQLQNACNFRLEEFLKKNKQ